MYFIILIELFWNKEWIMEVYLNFIEMGNGIYGVEVVVCEYFYKNVSKLILEECVLIVVSFFNFCKFNLSRFGNYMFKR